MSFQSLTLTLEEPFTCSANPVVSNEIYTVDHVPATILRGAIYTALVRAGRAAEVERWLGLGADRPRYSSALPVEGDQLAVPMPLSFLNDKGDAGLQGQEGCVNSLWFAEEQLPKTGKGGGQLQWTRSSAKWLVCDANGDPVKGLSIDTESQMHVGLHYGRQASRKGALFSRAVLEAGMQFRFLLRNSPAGLAPLPNTLLLGKRRSAGNGAAKLSAPGAAAFAKGQPAGNEVVVQLLSDCLIPSENGGWLVGLDAAGWSRILGTPVKRVIASKSAQRQVFGWSGIWGRPREAATAIAAGSVYRLEFADGAAAGARALEQAEMSGIGSRVEEGFGWIVANPQWLFAGSDRKAFGGPAGDAASKAAKGMAPNAWPGLEEVRDRKRLIELARMAWNPKYGRKLAEMVSLAERTGDPARVWAYLQQMASREHARDWDRLQTHLERIQQAKLGIAELKFVLGSAAMLSRGAEREGGE